MFRCKGSHYSPRKPRVSSEMFTRKQRPSSAAAGGGAKNRAPLANITNRKDVGSSAPVSSWKILGAFAAKGDRGRSFSRNASLGSELSVCLDAQKSVKIGNGTDYSSSYWSEGSISKCDSLVLSESFETPEVSSANDEDSSSTQSTERSNTTSLLFSEKSQMLGNMSNTDSLLNWEIFEHLCLSEVSKRPSMGYMEKYQKDIDASMRAVLVDWLVEVTEEFGLVPETLFLSVNYIDRYLSSTTVSRQRLQLLGVTCMMIAAKYEEVVVPDVEDFCFITDYTYCKEEVLQMESHVLNQLKFEMTAPTTDCFLRWYIWASNEFKEVPSLQLECLLNYLAELSLLDYSMLRYAPSITAASAVFLAKFMLSPSKKPWNSVLVHYTLYHPSDLCECVKALHHLCLNRCELNVTAVRRKYSHHKYKFVAKKYCPPSIPKEFFED